MEISYCTSLLQIFAIGTEGKNAITEVKCQSHISLETLVKLYKAADFVYPLK